MQESKSLVRACRDIRAAAAPATKTLMLRSGVFGALRDLRPSRALVARAAGENGR